MAAAIGAAWAAGARGVPPQTLPAVPHRPIAGRFSFGSVGDLIYLRPMLPTLEARQPKLVRILRSADAAFGNFEATIIDINSFEGSPQAESGGAWLIADPHVAKDLRSMGFRLVSRANNHATDWGVDGMSGTDKTLRDAGLAVAGTGSTLSAARLPAYVDVPIGRLGLVAATTSFTPMSRASDPYGMIRGRPGVNAIRVQSTRFVSGNDYEILARYGQPKGDGTIDLGDLSFRVTDEVNPVGSSKETINSSDLQGNLLAIRLASQNSNFVVFSLHNHEPGNRSETPSAFAVTLAHAAVDSGADEVIGHGPHQLRGIEIYKGRPIFYSLGNFAMMTSTMDIVPKEMFDDRSVDTYANTTPELLQLRNKTSFPEHIFYESVIAISRFDSGRLVDILLYPIELHFGDLSADHGVPALADEVARRRILKRLQRLSEAFGTKIKIAHGIGRIKLSNQPSPFGTPSLSQMQRSGGRSE